MLMAGLIQLVWVLGREGLDWLSGISLKGWVLTFCFTLTSALSLGLFYQAIATIDAANAGFISRTSIIVQVMLGMALLRERFSLVESVAGLLVIAGAFIIKGGVSLEMSAGFWLMLASAACFGVVEVCAKVAVRHVPPLYLNTVRNTIAGILLAAMALIGGKTDWGMGRYWWGVAGIAVFGPLAARIIFLNALRHIEVSKAALVSQIQPIYIVILSVLLLSEFPNQRTLIGGGLIILGCVGVYVFRPRIPVS